ncbi:hypothetical protein [Moritella yayanosii]|uniref:hypothetical protein n=1 Tax=Moritella yayanosii TaxID=69539 RepID=UPI001E5D1E4D|nr:hypothetical protein [Moritella yayanosii]
MASGLTFATVLTLVLTPCMLVLGDRLSQRWNKGNAVVNVRVVDSDAMIDFYDIEKCNLNASII